MNGKTSDNLLVILSRAPIAGETKTRLGRTIGMERAAELHHAFLRDYIERFVPAAGPATFQVAWGFTPPGHDFRATIAGLCPGVDLGDVLFLPQEGGTFGERQANLLRWGSEHGYRAVILIGTDSPQTPVATITSAFALLERHYVVTGLVQEGGYYLIGMRGYHDVLGRVPMSTGQEAATMIAAFVDLGLSCGLVPPSFDVDVAEDLPTLIAALEPDGSAAPATWTALALLGLRPG